MKYAAHLIFSLTLALLASCTSEASQEHDHEHHGYVAKKAVCVIRGTTGNDDVTGTVTFTQEEGGVRIQASVSGLTPGDHGFHVHQWGDTNCGDGKCTGGHFDPHGSDHGAPDAEVRHVGDLGNLTAGDDGAATYDRVDSMISLDMNMENCIIGRAIIIHADPDDFGQPTGNAGARVAAGVIGIAE